MLSIALAITIGCGGATSPAVSLSHNTWGSPDASLTITDSAATLLILASGGCYGSFGQIGLPIPSGQFSRAGKFTQLMGAYPGRVEYAAQYDGAVDADQMSITISVPALQRVIGPFHLTAGQTTTWPACLYP